MKAAGGGTDAVVADIIVSAAVELAVESRCRCAAEDGLDFLALPFFFVFFTFAAAGLVVAGVVEGLSTLSLASYGEKLRLRPRDALRDLPEDAEEA